MLLSLASNPSLTLFYLLILSFVSQFGRHFWPSYAFVNGLRVDYLSPTLYVSDILIALLFLELLPYLSRKVSWYKLLIVSLILTGFAYLAQTSQSPWNSLLGVMRLLEVIFVAWSVTFFLRRPRTLYVTRYLVALTLAVVSLLSCWQVLWQHSIGGLWYYFGERTFSTLTPGIANASLNGTLVLRPYATFPHPNVLAAFSVIMVAFLLFSGQSRMRKWQMSLVGLSCVLGCLTTFLTLSRTGIAVLLLVLGVWIMWLIRKNKKLIGLGVVVLLCLAITLYVSGSYLRFSQLRFSDETIVIREFLLSKAYVIFTQHPLTGVGLQNFLPALSYHLSPLTPLAYFQPVHSVYLLILAETGIIGVALFGLFLFYAIYKIISSPSMRLMKTLLLIAFLLLSLTDHYFYTLHQGQLLAAFVFGIVCTDLHFTTLTAKNLRKASRSQKAKKSLTAQPLKFIRTGA